MASLGSVFLSLTTPISRHRVRGSALVTSRYNRDLKLNLPGGCWRQSLSGAGPHQVLRKKGSDKKHPNALKYPHFHSKTQTKNYHPVGHNWPVGHEFETPALHPLISSNH